MSPRLPNRPRSGHKGTFGTLLVVGGCCEWATRMVGAPALAALAGLRAGAGLARIACPEPIIDAVLALCPSATGIAMGTTAKGAIISHEAAGTIAPHMASAHAIVVGPGMGLALDPARDQAAFGPHATLALTLLSLGQTRVPVVVDADALNALALAPDLTRDLKAPAVLTPHPGEFRRLASSLAITSDPTEPSTRAAAAEELAQRLGCVVVLKGAGTVVTNGHDTWVCDRGHPCLATAGTGDVLAGLLGGLLAQWSAERLAPVSPSTSPGTPAAPNPTPGGVLRIATGEAMSKEQLMALAAAKLGRPAPTATGASAQAPLGSSRASPTTLLDVVRVGVEAHAIAGERWAAKHRASAGLLAHELADELPEVLETFRV